MGTAASAALAAAILAAASPAAMTPADPPVPNPSIPWLTSFEHALERAAMLRQPIMIDLWAKWCGWCRVLDSQTYTHPEVIRRAQGMTCVKVNADQEPAIGLRFQVRGLPTILFLDRNGQEIDRQRGFARADAFAGLMDDVLVQADRSQARADELARDPDDPVRIYALADELIAQGRSAEAEPLLISLTPEGSKAGSAVQAEAMLDLAVVRADLGDQESARKILAEFIDAYPDSPRRDEAALRLGQLLVEAGKKKDACRHLESVAKRDPKSWKAAEAKRLLGLSTGAAGRGGVLAPPAPDAGSQ